MFLKASAMESANLFEMKEEDKVPCVKIFVLPVAVQKFTNILIFYIFEWVFLKPPTNRPPTNRPTNHLRPTIYQPTNHRPTDHWPIDHQPIRNMGIRNLVINFKWISDKKIWDRVINTISRMWVIIFWLKPECVIEKIKSLKVKLIKYKTYRNTFE